MECFLNHTIQRTQSVSPPLQIPNQILMNLVSLHSDTSNTVVAFRTCFSALGIEDDAFWNDLYTQFRSEIRRCVLVPHSFSRFINLLTPHNLQDEFDQIMEETKLETRLEKFEKAAAAAQPKGKKRRFAAAFFSFLFPSPFSHFPNPFAAAALMETAFKTS